MPRRSNFPFGAVLTKPTVIVNSWTLRIPVKMNARSDHRERGFRASHRRGATKAVGLVILLCLNRRPRHLTGFVFFVKGVAVSATDGSPIAACHAAGGRCVAISVEVSAGRIHATASRVTHSPRHETKPRLFGLLLFRPLRTKPQSIRQSRSAASSFRSTLQPRRRPERGDKPQTRSHGC
jgi:hypothetical protein